MKIIIHEKAKNLIRILSFPEEEVILINTDLISVFWELCDRNPDELIGWCEKGLEKDLDWEQWEKIFHHDLIMASYAVKTRFLSDSIGYVDQLPFIKVNRKVLYATWQMSSDIGGIKGEVARKLKPILNEISDFEFFINSAAKIGQQNGLFCYSDPAFFKFSIENIIESTASVRQLFIFVYQHYNSVWTNVLLWCFFRYEKKFPIFNYIQVFRKKKIFRKSIDFSEFDINSDHPFEEDQTIDVVIPTIGRSQYLLQVLVDLKNQILLPKRVIVVEQNSRVGAITELNELTLEKWPFEVVHHFINKTGACNARNIALENVNAEWTFFADDDIRIKPDILSNAMKEINRFKLTALNLNCIQPGDNTIFKKIKQWGSFGSGTSIVKSDFAKKCSFPLMYEYGYGEDTDFGMQLRNIGCDIVYHPDLKILHLKAPVGGLRQKPILDWEKEKFQPKPSPTFMAFVYKYFTPQQFKGYKVSLFLKYYSKQEELNPIKYLRLMKKRWQQSEKWAITLLKH